MTTSCDDIRDRIAEEGAAALAEGSETEAHVAGCEACCAFVESLVSVDRALASLPALDAPDETVARVLARASEPAQNGAVPGAVVVPIIQQAPRSRVRRWLLGTGAAAAGLLVVAVGSAVLLLPTMGRRDAPLAGREPSVVVPGAAAPPPAELLRETERASRAEEQQRKKQDSAKAMAAPETPADGDLDGTRGPIALTVAPAGEPKTPEEATKRGGQAAGLLAKDLVMDTKNERTAEDDRFDANLGPDDKLTAGAHRVTLGKSGYAGRDQTITTGTTTPLGWLDGREKVDELVFIEPRGYFANTYVPGDPALRILEARLAEHRALHGAAIPRGLDDAAARPDQPFDAPDRAALALFVHADRRRVEGPARALLQIGLEGARTHGRRRPPMNVGLVIDARGALSEQEAASMRAIATAFAAAKAPGDRFSITVAGKPGAMVVAPERFRAGTVAAAMDAILAPNGEDRRPALELTEAMELAVGGVAETGDESQPLGASGVILVTAAPLGAPAERVTRIAHSSAVAGIPVGVFAAGARVSEAELTRLALAGQGTRRLVAQPSDAAGAVEQELGAVSRAVARAVRLDIRLAPNVKLIEVLGSHRLGAVETRRVKEAEEAIDRRLAKSMGIAADRGQDDAGIQIVIPGFYSGDSHVILLDVVVAGPGPVAEVSAKYKDLVQLENGTARASLTLERGAGEPGPLERNVIVNFVEHLLSQELSAAAEALRRGDLAAARATLDAAHQHVAAVAARPSFAADPDLAADLRMLAQYITLAGSGFGADPAKRTFLADSLAYAAMLERLPRPKE